MQIIETRICIPFSLKTLANYLRKIADLDASPSDPKGANGRVTIGFG
jgi:hypothetical protein